jgi:hypothetical protein
MWLFDSLFLKDEIIKWLLFFFFTLDLSLFNEKRRISLGRRKLGWALEYPYYLSKKKKQCLNLGCIFFSTQNFKG